MRYRIEFVVDVVDEEKLLAYADRRVNEAWGTSLDDITTGGESTLERGLLEAILFSNENPSPDEWGVEFTGIVTIGEI